MRRVRVLLIRLALALIVAVTATAAGYWVSAQLGRDLLRDEAESQLERLLKGDVSIQALRIGDMGLRLEGENVRVYPKLGGHGLVASHVVAKIDPLSLLVGRFHLRSLLIVDAHFAIERDSAGSWGPYPIASLDRDDDSDSDDDGDGDSDEALDEDEPQLTLHRAFEKATRYLLEEAKIADLLVLRGGLVTFVDHDSPAGGDAPVEFSLSDIRGTLDHRWLSNAPELEIDSVFGATGGPPAKVEIEGNNQDETLRITVAATNLAMEAFQPYAAALGAEAELDAALSGTFAFETSDEDTSVSEIDWVARQLVCAFPRRGAQVRFESPDSRMTARLEVHPDRVRLVTARVQGREVAFDALAHIARPLRESSEARLALSVRGTRLPELRRFVGALPKSDREPLLKLMDPVESARIVEVHASGTTRVSTWREVFAGRVDSLPPGFVLGAEVDDLTVAIGDGSQRATDMSGHIDWSGDRIEIRDLGGLWNAEPIPEIDAVVDGFTRLLAGDEEARKIDRPAPQLSGLPLLQEIVRDLAGDEDDAPTSSVPPIELTISSLRHPVLRWPLLDAQLSLKISDRSSNLTIHEGWWSGAPIRGEVVWLREPERQVHVGLEVLRPRDLPARDGADSALPVSLEGPGPASSGLQATDEASLGTDSPEPPWLEGRMQVGAMPDAALGFRELSGRFAAVGTTLRFSQVALALEPKGEMHVDLALNLEGDQAVGTQGRFELKDADLSRVSRLFGVPTDLATGTVRAEGSIDGSVAPNSPPLAGLVGSVSVRAKEGELRKRIPMIVAVATATEGFNPFSSRESVLYETVETDLVLDHGVVRTEAFELEGPMRVFATGKIDVADEATIDAVVGVFLFRQADRMLGKLPLVKNLISDKGLIGAYFAIKGPVADPDVRALPGKTLAESMPSVVKAPFKVLEFLLSPRDPKESASGERQKARPGPGRRR